MTNWKARQVDLNECLPHQLQYSFSCFLSSLVPYAMGKEGQFQHLNGARSLVAFWIVCAHYMPKGTATGDFLNGAVFRVNVAVCFFVVVSGFVTHWTSEGRPLESVNELLHFYVRRLSRVLVTFWLAMLWAVYLQHKNGQELQVDYVVRCLCLVEQWVHWPTPQKGKRDMQRLHECGANARLLVSFLKSEFAKPDQASNKQEGFSFAYLMGSLPFLR
ncbi:Carnosine synthase 1 [Durusdinium trenchii]|uniref:Carnosine synthase 1 n=1 Tax=Durusdinium trenchii TaxID=1381693 RepID=A0ABP0QCH7_9DINO